MKSVQRGALCEQHKRNFSTQRVQAIVDAVLWPYRADEAPDRRAILLQRQIVVHGGTKTRKELGDRRYAAAFKIESLES